MINIDITQSHGHTLEIIIKGHGLSGWGNDLVCAGVSSCYVGAMNALKDIEGFDIQIREGDSFVKAKKIPSEHDEIVLETLIIQLMTIANGYPKECSIRVIQKEG